jgi:hypothetical protein
VEPELIEQPNEPVIYSLSCLDGLHEHCDHEECLCDCHLQDEDE